MTRASGCAMGSKRSYSAILKPLKVGPLTIKNRLEVSPAENHMASKEGWVTREFLDFTATLAASGAGIVTIGDSPVTKEYFDTCPFTLNMSDPLVVNGLARLADTIHRYGAVASIELNLRNEERLPADYTTEELEEIIEAFAVAAKHARQAGFDMVMVHAGHGHVIDQFFHPYFNKRTDAYGADTLENRCRFAKEVVAAVRGAIGRTMAIEMRMSGDERLPGICGMGVEEMALFAEQLQDSIDLLHVSSGNLYDMHAGDFMIQGPYMPHATNVALASYIKKRVRIPVTSVGSFTLPLAEEALEAGDCDMVAMIRGFISDPECLKKAIAGLEEEIRPCLRCSSCTGGGPGVMPRPTRCAVNPLIGREYEFPSIKMADRPKRVAIVGGGAAGMEAAYWLAQRGHRPTIYEKSSQLGGNLAAAGRSKLKLDVRNYATWAMRRVMDDSRIAVELNVEVTPDLLRTESPDVVVVATGAEFVVPDVPGIDLPLVRQAVELDDNPERAGKRVVVIGAGLTGSETALLLARSGREVTVVVRRSCEALVAEQGMNLLKAHMYCRDEGVTFVEQAALAACTEEGALIKTADGSSCLLPCDTIALSVGLRPNTAVVDAFWGIAPETFVVGDCKRSRLINDAVREGFYAAMLI